MKRIAILFFSIFLCVPLVSCTGARDTGESPPASVPELESIIEPVSRFEPESRDEPSVPVSEPARELPVEVPYEAPAPVAVESNVPAPPVAESSAVARAPQAASSAPQEALRAVSPDPRLDVEEIETELLRLINGLRGETGVLVLVTEDSMWFAARIRAVEALDSFSHTRPDQTPYHTAFDESGFAYAGKWHGENLSSMEFTAGMFNEKEIALRMFNGLKDSPGHYRNMIGEQFAQAGIGVAINYGGDVVDIASAQLFSSL